MYLKITEFVVFCNNKEFDWLDYQLIMIIIYKLMILKVKEYLRMKDLMKLNEDNSKWMKNKKENINNHVNYFLKECRKKKYLKLRKHKIDFV